MGTENSIALNRAKQALNEAHPKIGFHAYDSPEKSDPLAGCPSTM